MAEMYSLEKQAEAARGASNPSSTLMHIVHIATNAENDISEAAFCTLMIIYPLPSALVAAPTPILRHLSHP